MANGGGTSSTSGLFTAGATPGTYANTVVATSGGMTGTATVTVNPGTPIVSAIAPVNGSTVGGVSVTISGSNFVNGAAVMLGGTPATNGTFNFSVRLRDYRENGPGVTNLFTMTVAPPPSFALALSLNGVGTNSQAQLSLLGTTGQRQVVETSSNLSEWLPLATNLTATNLFQLTETNTMQYRARFYRGIVRP